MATSDEGLRTSNDRRPVQIAAIGLGILLLLVVLWFVFVRSDNEVVETATPVPQTTQDPEEPDETPKPGGQRPVETFEVFAPKDPFDPLISAAAAAGQPASATTTTEGVTLEGGTTSGAGTGTTTTTINGGSGSGSEDVGGHRVRLIDVFRQGRDERAQVQVDGTVYTVDVGERFARSFELMSTSGQCATMLYGDDEFTLCEGEEILK